MTSPCSTRSYAKKPTHFTYVNLCHTVPLAAYAYDDLDRSIQGSVGVPPASTMVTHYKYDAFANPLVSTGAKANDFAYRFSTKPLHAETGLYYYGYRYYDPVTGRWPSRDPIEESGGFNLYGFITNDGINWVDLLGLKGQCEITIIAGHWLDVTTSKGGLSWANKFKPKCEAHELLGISCYRNGHGLVWPTQKSKDFALELVRRWPTFTDEQKKKWKDKYDKVDKVTKDDPLLIDELNAHPSHSPLRRGQRR